LPAALPEPDLARALAALNAAGARYVVIGGFAVIANAHVRATEDVDLLVPDEFDDARSPTPTGSTTRGNRR
jgi:predicted nucleotidyltransferase